MIYGLLFIYSFFAILGYLYYPGYSESLNAFFGIRAGQIALNFVFISMALLFAVNFLVYRKGPFLPGRLPRRALAVEIVGNPSAPWLLACIVVLFTIGMAIHWTDLSWYMAQEERLPLSLSVYLLLFKISVGLLIVSYVAVRENLPGATRLKPIAIVYLILFLVAAVKLGNRTDPTALTVGLLFFETSRRSLRPRTIVYGFLGIIVVIFCLNLIEYYRYDVVMAHTSVTERAIKNDYFAPAHMLFAAIAYNFIDPGEVLRSNLSNAAILFNYPYLQQTVTDLFNPGVATRSAGYAFFLLTEGYIACGMLGPIYNTIVVTTFVRLWNACAVTDNRIANSLIRTLFAAMAVNICRGQSSYFVKVAYTFVIPVLIFSVLLLGIRLGRRAR